MAKLNAETKRLKADRMIRDKGTLVEFRKQVLDSEGVDTEADIITYAWALFKSATPSVDRDIQNTDQRFLVSAQQTDVTGDPVLPAVMDIEYGDSVVRDGISIPVLEPGLLAPNDGPILYKVLAGTRTETAP